MEEITPIIVITHAAFDENRRRTLARLMAQLDGAANVHVEHDETRMGSLECWRRAMVHGLESGASHIVWLPDDAIVVPGFYETICRAIRARLNDVFDCYANHCAAPNLVGKTAWYTTYDGYVGLGGCMPRGLLEEHLRWRQERIRDGEYVGNDAGVNLWAMETNRLIYKTVESLVDHDDGIESLDGNGDHEWRRPATIAQRPDEIAWTTEPVHVGRTYRGSHWGLVKFLKYPWAIRRMYDVARAEKSSSHPHVFIATPAYQPPLLPFLESRHRVTEDLTEHGITVQHYMPPGDSLVTRGRQRIVHQFLQTPATHLLWWDNDIEALDPACVRQMLGTGHDVIAGAVPFKDTTRRVVCNPRQSDLQAGQLVVKNGCLEVQDAGTGFMLLTREAILRVIEANPDRLHFSLSTQDRNQPLWAVFDTAVEDYEYLSEDWLFCRLWQRIGGKVLVYVPARFRHFGLYGYEGSLEEQWGLEKQSA